MDFVLMFVFSWALTAMAMVAASRAVFVSKQLNMSLPLKFDTRREPIGSQLLRTGLQQKLGNLL